MCVCVFLCFVFGVVAHLLSLAWVGGGGGGGGLCCVGIDEFACSCCHAETISRAVTLKQLHVLSR